MPANIIEFTKEKIGSNEQLQTFIQRARSVSNVIFPETLPFSDTYAKLGVEVVTVDVKNERDAYKNESGGYSLHLSKLNEIAKAAKIRVIDSRILERKTDEKGKVTFISHQVKVQYRTVSGEMISETFTGKYDYFRDVEKYTSEKQIKQRRTHAEALAESNALTRAFNKVLPQLPQSFEATELNKPFLIPYVEEDKDAVIRDLPLEDQKKIKTELARKRLGLVNEIFPASHGNGTYTKSQNQITNIEDAQVVEEKKEEKKNEGFTPEQINHLRAEEFRGVDQKERTEKILALSKLKGVTNSSGSELTAKQIEHPKNTIDKQIEFIEKLLNMPDLEEELPKL